MKILLVNKFLHPKGGAETYVQTLGSLLQQHGHQVQYFGLADPRNTLGNREGIYVSPLDLNAGIHRNLTAPLRIIYSREARRKLRQLLEAYQPDAVHLNNIHFHLTPSVILAVHAYRTQTRRRVKIIYTAHDYQLICPSHGLLDSQGQLCEKCLDGHYFSCFRGKCLKNSRSKSLLATLNAYFWHYHRAYDHIDTIICCSHFLKSKLDTQPRFRNKTVALHNFAEVPVDIPTGKKGYVLEFGHLSRDKGTLTLLEAASRMPEVTFLFAGFGAAEADIRKLPNCQCLGFLTGEALGKVIAEAAVTVCPSQWYENCPYCVIESLLSGTPVVASQIGGIPELIRPGFNGELFTPGDAKALEEKLRLVLARPEWYSANCRNSPRESPEQYCQRLTEIYGGGHESI